MDRLREVAVVERDADLPLRRLAIDDGADGRELQPEALVIVEAGDLLARLPPDARPDTMSLSSGTSDMSLMPE